MDAAAVPWPVPIKDARVSEHAAVASRSPIASVDNLDNADAAKNEYLTVMCDDEVFSI